MPPLLPTEARALQLLREQLDHSLPQLSALRDPRDGRRLAGAGAIAPQQLLRAALKAAEALKGLSNALEEQV